MKLDRLVLVNWGQLRPGNYELGDLTLLTGATGAGKSTWLDGIQTLMTASYQGIVAYNPGQEEVQQNQRRGKSKRTLESYVVGGEYSLFSRPAGAQGYIAGVFRPGPEDGSAKMFTAVLAASARVDGGKDSREAKLERLVLVIVEEAELTFEDFFENVDEGLCIAVEDIVKRLKAKHAKVVSYDDHKRDYLCGLYGRFRGRGSIPWEEAQNAAKAWSASIAYKPMGSVHELVRDEILEFDGKQLQENIARISDLMRQVTNLKVEGQRIEGTVTRLRELKFVIGKTTGIFEEQVQLDLLLAKLQVANDEDRIEAERARIKEDNALAERYEAKAETETQLKRSVDGSRIEIAAKLSGIAAHTEKKTLDEKLDRATSSARAKLNELSASLKAALNIKRTSEEIVKQPVKSVFPKLRASVDAVGQVLASTNADKLSGLLNSVLNTHGEHEMSVEKLFTLGTAFDGIEVGMSQLHSALVGADGSVLMAVASETDALEKKIDEKKRDRAEWADRKQKLSSGAGNYDRYVEQAVERIREKLPDAGVQVLCDLVEPVSQEWQPAIEGYMGGARFSLIVKPEWERPTIDYLQTWGSSAKVIQGKRCLANADESRVPGNSIIHELRTENPIANAYLIEQFGSVVKVPDSETLRTTPRGLTKDGKASGGMTMFILESKKFVLGRLAREMALKESTEELEKADRELSDLMTRESSLEGIRKMLATVKEPTFDASPLSLHAGDIDATRRAISQLDLTEVEQLRAELARLEDLIGKHDLAIGEANKAVALAQQRMMTSEGVIERINAGRDSRFQERDTQLSRLKNLCAANDEVTYTVLAQEVDDMLASGTHEMAAVHARIAHLRSQPEKLLGDVREMLAEYNATVRADERFQSALPHLTEATLFDPYYGPLVNLGKSIRALHTDLESIGLYNNRTKVEEAERSFRDVFTKQFCIEVKSKVDDGVRLLRQLNNELAKMKFATDQFSIDWSKWEAEYLEYYGFFSAVAELADSPDTVDLFGETELSPKHIQVRDRLVKLLLDQDQDKAGRELLRIADYRNYRRYEIWNDSSSGGRIALSTWGTGSAGQLETPAYIVRAAVVTNRLKIFDKGASLRMLVNDESFSKMDESRARAVLKYLSENMGMQLVCAMPTKHAGGLRPEFDREYSYSRMEVENNGEIDFVSDADERIYKKARMRELWEAQRKEVRDQAKLKFEDEEPKDDDGGAAGDAT